MLRPTPYATISKWETTQFVGPTTMVINYGDLLGSPHLSPPFPAATQDLQTEGAGLDRAPRFFPCTLTKQPPFTGSL